MRKSELEKKANQLLALGVRMERLVGSLPPGVVCNWNNTSHEISRVVAQIERAAAEKKN